MSLMLTLDSKQEKIPPQFKTNFINLTCLDTHKFLITSK